MASRIAPDLAVFEPVVAKADAGFTIAPDMGLADSPYKVMIRPCIPFLERVSEAEGERLVAGSRQVRHPAASVAFHRGDDMQVAILAAGLARVFISTTSGSEATVRYVHKGELLG